jgi:hypothetical protein
MVLSLLHTFLPSDGAWWPLEVVLADLTKESSYRCGKLAASVSMRLTVAMSELDNKQGADSASCSFSYFVLQTTLFTLLFVNVYNYEFLFELYTRFRSVQGSRPYTAEYGERLRRLENGLNVPTLGIKKKVKFSTVRTDTCNSVSHSKATKS